MSTNIVRSGYGYWVDPHANVHPVSQAGEHSGVVQKEIGAEWEKALALKWVRVSVYATDGVIYFEYDPTQGLPSPAQMQSLRDLSVLHSLPLYDEVKKGVLEAIRPSWASRFPAT